MSNAVAVLRSPGDAGSDDSVVVDPGSRLLDPVVTITDLRSAKLCCGGGRRVAAAHGLSWDHFITYGYPASVLAAVNDPLINRMIAEAHKRVRQ